VTTPRDSVDRAFEAWLREGRPEDLAEVFDATAPRLLLLAAHLAPSGLDAEDLVQATFVRAIEIGPERFERGRPVLPWLSGILALEVRKAGRSERRRPDQERLGAEASEAGPDEIAASAELRHELERAIAGLPEGYSQVLNLRLAHGLTPAEIGHALGVPVETVRTRLRRGIERLRERLPIGFAGALLFLAGAGRSLSTVREVVLAGASGIAAAGGGAAVSATAVVAAAGGGAAGRTAIAKAAVALLAVGAGVFGARQFLAGPAEAPMDGPRVGLERPERDREPGPERIPVRTALQGAGQAAAEEPPVVAARYASLEGRFRDERGVVAGVDVTLLRLHEDALLLAATPLPEPVVAPPFAVGASVTDAGGRFVFEQVPPGGVWLLRVDAPERPSFVLLVAARPPLDERIDLGMQELPPVWETEGRVVDADLRPVPGAVLRRAQPDWDGAAAIGPLGDWLRVWGKEAAREGLLLAERQGGGRAFGVLVEAPTWLAALAAFCDPAPVAADANGRFRWRSVHGFRESLAIDAPGFRPRRIEVALSRDGAEQGQIELERWDRVELKVVDAAGDPVVGAEVAAAVSTDAAPGVRGLRRGGRTGPDGTLRVDGVRGLPMIVAARAAEGTAWHVERVAEGLSRTLRLPLLRPVVLRVRSAQGLPVAGAEVRLWPGSRGGERAVDALLLAQLGALDPVRAGVEAGEDGELRFAAVPEGDFVAVLTAPGFASRAVPLRVGGPVDERIELAPRAPTRIELFGDGFEPMRGLRVVARPRGRADAAFVLPFELGRTDREAVVVLEREPYVEHEVALVDPGYGQELARIGAGIGEIRLQAGATGGIDGVVIGRNPDPAAAGWLLAARRGGRGLPVLLQPDGDGVVRASELPAGEWELAVRSMPGPLSSFSAVLELLWPGELPAARMTVPVVGRSSTGFRIDTAPQVEAPEVEEPAGLRGTLLLDGGVSPALRLALIHGGREVALGLDADGRFDAGPEVRGAVELVVRLATVEGLVEIWRAAWTVEATGEPLTIDLGTAPFSAIFTTAGGERAAGVAVGLRGEVPGEPSGRVALRLAASAGGFVAFDRLPAGDYALVVMDPRLGWLRREGFRVGPSRVTQGMSIRLEPLLRARGPVVDAGVEVPQTSEIDLVRQAEDGVELTRIAVCDADGRFAVDGLLPGRYRATLRAAIRIRRFDGVVVLIPPAASGIVVPLTDLVVPDRDLADATLTRR
jgi:RNA polymerase sigma-70 factor (ECF subfamily)